MNILLATHNFLPYHVGGTEIYVLNLAKFLTQRGHNVTIIAAIDLNIANEYDVEYEDNNIKIIRYLHDNLTVLGVNYKTIKTKQIYAKYSTAHTNSYGSYFENNHFDILHINGFTAAIGLDLILSLKSKIPEIKVVSSYHTPISDPKETLTLGNTFKEQPQKINYVADGLSYRFNLPYWFTEKITPFLFSNHLNILPAIFNIKYYIKLNLDAFQQLINITDEWWVYSEGIKEVLSAQVKLEKIKFQRHGIDPIFFGEKNLAKGSHKFLFNGRLLKIKGFITLLKAWVNLEDNGLKELWITGTPNCNDKVIKKLLKKISLRKDIKWLGNLSQEQLAQIYLQVNTVIIPSEWYEIGPLVFHEAIASGCTVIASNIGGCKELTRYFYGSTTSFKTGNVKDLKNKISQQPSFEKGTTKNKPTDFKIHFEIMIQQSEIYS
ncbi:glycosyltransferase family 4 protein [Pedobacter sp.]|uniref:glycosyltransferase family 4 protein n=1 Tax=Pedobacter sp. TaxID=1411316 RepID=UPI003BAC4F5E